MEIMRRHLRDIVHHIDWSKKAIVFSHFVDEPGDETAHDLPTVGDVDLERFKAEARHFLREQPATQALQRLRRGQPLTDADLQSPQQLLIGAGIANELTIEAATQAANGFGRFVRSLVGLERRRKAHDRDAAARTPARHRRAGERLPDGCAGGGRRQLSRPCNRRHTRPRLLRALERSLRRTVRSGDPRRPRRGTPCGPSLPPRRVPQPPSWALPQHLRGRDAGRGGAGRRTHPRPRT